MLYTIKSRKPIAEIERDLEESAARHKFGILTSHNLRETMKKKGVEFNSNCWIYEVCNPDQAKKVLEANGAISTALPCRISVYGAEGDYTLATILPTALMTMFASPELAPVAQEVETVIKAMMQDAAGASVAL
ncbi:MAG TPA: DUF302 domain-containing protein [Bryobacteraceae bacterium]|nr:DUF302 domain-containing protein [Bryobacteraceae bacterium]